MSIFHGYRPKFCASCVQEISLTEVKDMRGCEGLWFHSACFQEFYEEIMSEEKEKPASNIVETVKHGFVLGLAYCKFCTFNIDSRRHFVRHTPNQLKEEIFSSVVKAHDESELLPRCPKRELVVVYNACVYEESEVFESAEV